MARTRNIAMILISVLSLSAVAATSAYAATKKGELVNKSGGALIKTKFTGTSGSGVFETTGGLKLTCTEGTETGTISSKTHGSATITYTGCETGGGKCETPGQASGTVVLPVSLALAPEKEKATTLTDLPEGEVTCSQGLLMIKEGSVTAAESLEAKLSTTNTIVANGSKGVQELESELGKHLQLEFPGKAYENVSLHTEFKITFEEEAEFI